MRNRRNYADGYLPKIAYHIYKKNPDNVTYFTQRQEETYGKLSEDDLKKVIDMVMEHIETKGFNA